MDVSRKPAVFVLDLSRIAAARGECPERRVGDDSCRIPPKIPLIDGPGHLELSGIVLGREHVAQ